MVKRVALISTTIFALSASSFAQKELVGHHQYPQFRSMNGVPGSGFPLTSDGRVDYRGAMSLSTPIAYGLKGNRFVFGLSSLSSDMTPKFPRSGRRRELNVGANGTLQLLYGVDLKEYGQFTPSVIILSGFGDSAFNFQYTAPPLKNTPLIFAVGVQDIAGQGGASGDGHPTDGDKSTSLYGVATYAFDRWDAYMSLGVGSRRFQGIFGNASITVAPNVKGYVEYDTFNWNAGVGWLVPVSKQIEREQALTLQVGVVRGKYLSTTINFNF